MSRVFVRQCKEYHTFFEGYQVPVGAIYGRTKVCGEELFWVCDTPKEVNKSSMHVHFMKRSWNTNQSCKVNKITWHTMIVGKSHIIFAQVKSMCSCGIPHVGTYKNPQKKTKLSLEDKFTIGLKKHPQPQARCYKQAQVDGKGYDTYFEETYRELENYSGLPVDYRREKPTMESKSSNPSFGYFEGTGSACRDGMKVKQIKCRPGKPYTVK